MLRRPGPEAIPGLFSVIISGAAAAPSNARLLNLSARSLALSGDTAPHPGVRDQRQHRQEAAPPGRRADTQPTAIQSRWHARPRLRLLERNPATTLFEEIAANDNWATNANAAAITQTAADLFAFPFNADHESALLMDLPPGEYTAIAGDVNDATGIAIVELYDADDTAIDARLINISNRGFCGARDQVSALRQPARRRRRRVQAR